MARGESTVLPVASHSIKDIDSYLHRERLTEDGDKSTYAAELSSLPNGAFVEIDGQAYLVWRGALWLWSFSGYRERLEIEAAPKTVTVLTPLSIVATFAAGFVPNVHPTIGA